MSFNRSASTGSDPAPRRKRLDELTLSNDILQSLPPLHAHTSSSNANKVLSNTLGWKDVVLGVNVVTQTVFPLFHVTGTYAHRCLLVAVSTFANKSIDMSYLYICR